MISVAPGEIVLRGEVSNRYIGMDSHGNLLTYVSINDVTAEDSVSQSYRHVTRANQCTRAKSSTFPSFFFPLLALSIDRIYIIQLS